MTAFLALALTAVLAAPVAGQTPLASIRGVVLDPSALPIPGVQVAIVRPETGERRSVTADGTGRFVLAAIPPGALTIQIEHTGYKTYTQQIRLQVGEERRVDIQLTLGQHDEAVIVTAPAVAVERLRPARTTAIDGEQIRGLPLDGRNFLELSLLAPGTAPEAQGSASSVRGDVAFHVNGGREDSNGYLLDGVINVDPKLNTLGVSPPVDAVQEFELITSTPDASFGRNSAGQVNVVVKAGANELRGTAYEFFRDRALNAANAFAPKNEPDPAYSRHQFGGAFGGPLVKNRTFFFGDYEGTRTREGITSVTNVPTPAERNGDFSQSLAPHPFNLFTQQPFPNGVIPAAFINPVGRAIAARYPLPNRDVPFQNYVSSPVSTDRRHQYDLRVDHSDGHSRATLTGRYSFSDRHFFEPFSGAGFALVPGFGTSAPRRAQNAMGGERRVMSNALLNEARMGYTRISAGAFQESTTNLNAQVGLPTVSADPRDMGLSLITLTGYSPLGDDYNTPQKSDSDQFQLADAVTYAHGRHLVRTGVEMRVVQQRAFRDIQARGFLSFADQAQLTGNALADLLLGLPVTTGVARLDNPESLRTHSYGAFVQDSIALSSRLTLSAGLRYEFNAPPYDANNHAAVYDPTTGSVVQVGTNGVPRGGYEADRNNWAPRVGAAWSIDASGKTVVRAGYGLYYDQSALAPGEGLYFNPPAFDLRIFFPLPGSLLFVSDPYPQQFPIFIPPSATTYQRDFQTAYVHQWNVAVQRQLGPSRVFDLAYVGSRGRDLLRGRDINQADASPQIPNLRPNPLFADITQLESKAHSDYDSLQASFTQRLSMGVTALASYTWSSSHDDASGLFTSTGDPNFPQDSNNPEAEWGRSNFDLRHRLTFGFTCDMPFGSGSTRFANHGWASALLANWAVSGILTLQSGRPFTVLLSPDFDDSNTGRASLGFGANDRPNVSGDTSVAHPGAAQWFNTVAFSIPPFGTFGTAGRNIMEGPGYANFNLGVLKHVHLSRDTRLQFRLEAFNLFNRVNYNLPDNVLLSPTFGQILSAGSPRRLQLGAKVLF
jgi:hypothetical protein